MQLWYVEAAGLNAEAEYSNVDIVRNVESGASHIVLPGLARRASPRAPLMTRWPAPGTSPPVQLAAPPALAADCTRLVAVSSTLAVIFATLMVKSSGLTVGQS